MPEESAASIATNNYRKQNCGRKPKKREDPQPSAPWYAAPWRRGNPYAGQLAFDGPFLSQTKSGIGSHLDVFTLAHGAVGCGAYALAKRLNLPGFLQGVESFTALHACTDIVSEDLEDNGNTKLGRAIGEAQELFPLAGAIAIVNEDSVERIGTDFCGVIKQRAKSSDRSIIGPFGRWEKRHSSVLKAALLSEGRHKAASYEVVLADCGAAASHIWIIAKLLRDIGLNPIHAQESSSRSDLARIGRAHLIIGTHPFRPDDPKKFRAGSITHTLGQLTDRPVVWASFVSPSQTDASLREIASYFDEDIQRRAEAVIAENRKKTEAIVARYRPRLEGKLYLEFLGDPNGESVECYRLLGLRIGNRERWPGKTGVTRTPRLAWRWKDEKSLNTYLAEAKPDLAYLYDFEPSDWTKRGLAALPFSPLFDREAHKSCAYDGFAIFAATLDRHINAPWRKLVKPPWPVESG